MSAESIVSSVITNAQTQANAAAAKAIAYADAAKTAADGGLSLTPISNPTKPNVAVLPFTPTEDLSGLFGTLAGNVDASFKADFTTKVNDFLNTWFPDFLTRLRTAVDDWLYTTITAGGTGIPTAVESAIWERSRNRELKEAARIKSEATEAFASRGFSLPSGVLYVQLAMIDQAASDKISTHARDVAIKQIEIQVENIRFAVDKGLQFRLGIVSALVGYLNSFFNVPQLATERAKTQAELKRSLWEASAAYYRALIDSARLTLDYDRTIVELELGEQTNDVRNSIARTEGRVSAAVSAAAEMGKIAQAALSAQNTLAEISNQTIA